MGDPMTEAAKREGKERTFARFLEVLRGFYQEPSPERSQVAVKEAVVANNRCGGFWGDPTVLSREKIEAICKEKIELLGEGDSQEWAKLLFLARSHDLFQELKALSPFRDQIFVAASFVGGVEIFSRELEAIFWEWAKENGFSPRDYVFFFDPPVVKAAFPV